MFCGPMNPPLPGHLVLAFQEETNLDRRGKPRRRNSEFATKVALMEEEGGHIGPPLRNAASLFLSPLSQGAKTGAGPFLLHFFWASKKVEPGSFLSGNGSLL
jgi:hypothetical protein